MIDYHQIPRAELQAHLRCHRGNMRLLRKHAPKHDTAAAWRAISTQFNIMIQIFEIEVLLCTRVSSS